MDTRPACISLERRNHIIASAVEASINSRREAGEGIGDCQRPNFAAFGQLRPLANWSSTKSMAQTWLE